MSINTIKRYELFSAIQSVIKRSVMCAYCIAFTVLFSIEALSAGSYFPVHRNMLYNHSYFVNKHWRISGDTINYDTVTSFTALTPVRAVFSGAGDTAIALFATSDNKMYLMNVIVTPPQSPLDHYLVSTKDPVISPVGNASMITTIFPVAANNSSSLFLATAVAGSPVITLYKITAGSFSVASVDSVSCSGSVTITGLYGGPAQALNAAQSCIWAVGSNGAVRYFSYDGSAWSKESAYNLTDNETVSAFCKEALGTQSGKIYTFQTNVFTYNSKPCSVPIKTISKNGAAGGSGVVIKKVGSIWKSYTKGSADYTAFNFIARTDGSGVELLDGALNYSVYTLSDSPAVFTVKPDSVASYINNGFYNYKGMRAETISVRLRDFDGNYKIPSIVLNNSDTLLNNGSLRLESVHPDTECVPGFTDLSDTVVTLVLTSSKVSLIAKSRKAVLNVITGEFHWTYPLFQNVKSWFEKNKLSVASGSQKLDIFLINATTLIGSSTSTSKLAIHYLLQGGLSFIVAPNILSSIRIFNLHGQQIALAGVTENQTKVQVGLPLSATIVCVEYVFRNGASKRYTVSLYR